MILRSAGAADLPALAALHAACFARAWTAADLGALAAGAGGLLLLAAETGDAPPQGFILCRTVAGEAEVLTVAVQPHARRRGVAGALVGAACDAALAAGAEAMWLEAAADNAAALALYAGAGFVERGRRPRYYPRGAGEAAADALLLQRTLNTGASSPYPARQKGT